MCSHSELSGGAAACHFSARGPASIPHASQRRWEFFCVQLNNEDTRAYSRDAQIYQGEQGRNNFSPGPCIHIIRIPSKDH